MIAIAADSRQMLDLDGVAVPVISLADLKKNKSSTGRLHDLADVERLSKTRKQGQK